MRSGSLVFRFPDRPRTASSAAQGAALLRWAPNRRLARADPATALASTALGEGLAELLDPVDELEHEAGGNRVVRAGEGFDGEYVRALKGDRRVQLNGEARGFRGGAYWPASNDWYLPTFVLAMDWLVTSMELLPGTESAGMAMLKSAHLAYFARSWLKKAVAALELENW